MHQTAQRFTFELKALDSLSATGTAIAGMQVRGTPLFGATAAFGLVSATAEDAGDQSSIAL